MNCSCDACDALLANAVAVSHSMSQIQQMAIVIVFLLTLVIVNISYTLHSKVQNIMGFARDIVELTVLFTRKL